MFIDGRARERNNFRSSNILCKKRADLNNFCTGLLLPRKSLQILEFCSIMAKMFKNLKSLFVIEEEDPADQQEEKPSARKPAANPSPAPKPE